MFKLNNIKSTQVPKEIKGRESLATMEVFQ